MDDATTDTRSLPPEAVAAPTAITTAMATMEEDARLDRLAAPLAAAAQPLGEGATGAMLQGRWLGHALHPLLTDFPLGCWIGAGLLDLVGGRRSRVAARRLVGLGLLTVPITAAAGLSDYTTVRDPRMRRVGAVHALGNGGVALAYLCSWRARSKGRHLRGVAWGLVGGSLAWGTGYLGGHLSFGRGVGHGLRGMPIDAQPEGQEGARSPMGGAPTGPSSWDPARDVVGREEAAIILGAEPEQVDALVEQGLLVTADGGPIAVFRRVDVETVRLVGG